MGKETSSRTLPSFENDQCTEANNRCTQALIDQYLIILDKTKQLEAEIYRNIINTFNNQISKNEYEKALETAQNFESVLKLQPIGNLLYAVAFAYLGRENDSLSRLFNYVSIMDASFPEYKTDKNIAENRENVDKVLQKIDPENNTFPDVKIGKYNSWTILSIIYELQGNKERFEYYSNLRTTKIKKR